MSKELKIGFVSLVTIALMIWGFQYLKGKNLLKKNFTFEVIYPDVEGLDVSSPVEINGLAVGAITSIKINPENVRTMIVTFDVEGDHFLPNTTRALYSAGSIVGGKKIVLDFDTLCKGSNCLLGGERLQAGSRGMLETMISKEEMVEFFGTLRNEVGPVVDTVMSALLDENANNAMSNSIKSFEISMSNLASLTKNLDRLLEKSYNHLDKTIENMAVITSSFANTNDDMENMITNFSKFSTQLADADIGATLSKTGTTFDNTNALLQDLKTTIEEANTSFEHVNTLLSTIEQGDGTIAKLLNDPEIYYNLEATTKHLSLLLQDLRLNPKRYVRLSVFGRKGNQYNPPEEDPAFELRQEPVKDDY